MTSSFESNEDNSDFAQKLFSLDVTTSQRDAAVLHFASITQTQIDDTCWQVLGEGLASVTGGLLEALRSQNECAIEDYTGILHFFFVHNIQLADGSFLSNPTFHRLCSLLGIAYIRQIQEICYWLYRYIMITQDRHGQILGLLGYLEEAIYGAFPDDDSYLPDSFTGLEINTDAPEQLEYWINVYRDRLIAFYLVYFLKWDSSDTESHPILERRRRSFRKFYDEVCGADIKTAFNILQSMMYLGNDHTYDDYSTNQLDVFDVMEAMDMVRSHYSNVILPGHIRGIETFYEFVASNIEYQNIISRLSTEDIELILSLVGVPELASIMQTHQVVGELNGLGLFFFSDFFHAKASEIDKSKHAQRLAIRLAEEVSPNTLLLPIRDPKTREAQINQLKTKNEESFGRFLLEIHRIIHNDHANFDYETMESLVVELLFLIDKELSQFRSFLEASDYTKHDYPDSMSDAQINQLINRIANLLAIEGEDKSVRVIKVVKKIREVIYGSNIIVVGHDADEGSLITKVSPLISLMDRIVWPHYCET